METELDRLIAEQNRDDTDTISPEFRNQVPLTSGLANCVGYEDGQIVTFYPRPPKGTLLIGTATYHGTRSGYKNHGCRCAPCKGANAAYIKEYRGRRNGN